MKTPWYRRPIWGWLFALKTVVLCPVLYFLVAWCVVLFITPVNPAESFKEALVGDAVMEQVWQGLKDWWVAETVLTLVLTAMMYWMGALIDRSNERINAKANVE